MSIFLCIWKYVRTASDIASIPTNADAAEVAMNTHPASAETAPTTTRPKDVDEGIAMSIKATESSASPPHTTAMTAAAPSSATASALSHHPRRASPMSCLVLETTGVFVGVEPLSLRVCCSAGEDEVVCTGFG
eukprot:CAMPEP_0181310442 /NCGR_PEP_ID=MMETSP1101-20121128/12588_1 /TAXON_ID=46948 /ORGANISM="Rhodomonas abbreviata, Strain Caron Lab Isolate" /LENGTH=132 /DNA_ID=CAMNT_0023417071 /DNA_START=137 /DNA_END=535 /DNA_ORIENTATION=-